MASNRSAKIPDEVDKLTFTYSRGKLDNFVVNKSAGEEYWNEVKERVRDTFFRIEDRWRRRRSFRSGFSAAMLGIWIKRMRKTGR